MPIILAQGIGNSNDKPFNMIFRWKFNNHNAMYTWIFNKQFDSQTLNMHNFTCVNIKFVCYLHFWFTIIMIDQKWLFLFEGIIIWLCCRDEHVSLSQLKRTAWQPSLARINAEYVIRQQPQRIPKRQAQLFIRLHCNVCGFMFCTWEIWHFMCVVYIIRFLRRG